MKDPMNLSIWLLSRRDPIPSSLLLASSEIHVSFHYPWVLIASKIFSGIPTSPNPPHVITDLSGTSLVAARASAYTLELKHLTPLLSNLPESINLY